MDWFWVKSISVTFAKIGVECLSEEEIISSVYGSIKFTGSLTFLFRITCQRMVCVPYLFLTLGNNCLDATFLVHKSQTSFLALFLVTTHLPNNIFRIAKEIGYYWEKEEHSKRCRYWVTKLPTKLKLPTRLQPFPIGKEQTLFWGYRGELPPSCGDWGCFSTVTMKAITESSEMNCRADERSPTTVLIYGISLTIKIRGLAAGPLTKLFYYKSLTMCPLCSGFWWKFVFSF